MKKLENRLRNKLVKMLDELEDIGEEGEISNNYFYAIFDKPKTNIEISIEKVVGYTYITFDLGNVRFYYTRSDKELFLRRIRKEYFVQFYKLTEVLYEKIKIQAAKRNQGRKV